MGGKPSIVLPFLLNSCFLARFTSSCAGAIVQQDHKSIQRFHPLVNGTWVWHGTQGAKCWCDVFIVGPGVPCSLLAPAAKTGHLVTTSEGVEHWQGHTSVRTESFGNLMSSDEPEALPSSKGNPQFRDVERLADAVLLFYLSLEYEFCLVGCGLNN